MDSEGVYLFSEKKLCRFVSFFSQVHNSVVSPSFVCSSCRKIVKRCSGRKLKLSSPVLCSYTIFQLLLCIVWAVLNTTIIFFCCRDSFHFPKDNGEKKVGTDFAAHTCSCKCRYEHIQVFRQCLCKKGAGLSFFLFIWPWCIGLLQDGCYNISIVEYFTDKWFQNGEPVLNGRVSATESQLVHHWDLAEVHSTSGWHSWIC